MRYGRTMMVAVAVLVCAGFAQSREARSLSVPITVTETAGVARSKDPVSIGVPMPRGVLKDTGVLGVLDPKGSPVPAQFEVLMRWHPTPKYPDCGGSIRWVLVDFQADVPAKGKSTYRLVAKQPGTAPAAPGPRPASPVSVKESADSVTVDTGPLRFTINSKTFRLFDSVLLGGKKVVAAAGTDGLCVEGMDGTRYYASKDLRDPPKLTGADYTGNDSYLQGYQHNPPKRLRVTVEKKGPLHTVVMIDGVMQALSPGGGYKFVPYTGGLKKLAPVTLPSRDEQIGFRLRVHAYAGKPFVRVFHTLINLRGKSHTATDQNRYRSAAYIADGATHRGRFLIEAMELGTTLSVNGPLTYRVGGDTVHTGALRPRQRRTLYQDSSAGWIWQAATNRIFDPVLKANARRFKAPSGPARPYHEFNRVHFNVLTGQDGCSFMGYRVLDEADRPVAQGNRALGWADLSDGNVGLTTAVRWFWQMFPKSIELDGAGRVTIGILPRQWGRGHFMDGKIHRTHELFYRFHGQEAPGVALASATAFNHPLVGYCDFDWYLNSDACNLFARPAPEAWPNYEGQINTAVHVGLNPNIVPAFDSSIATEREKQDAFGWQHFGDTSKRGFRGHSQFQEFDTMRCLMMHYWRTGDPAFYRAAEELGRFLMGIPCFGGGYGHQHPESSHNWIQGLIDYYCVTGLPEALEGIHAMEGYYRRCQNPRAGNWHYNGRNAAYALNGLRQFFELTGDPTWLRAANTCIRDVRRRTRPVSGFYGGNPGGFMQHVQSHALGRYALLTGDEDAVDLLLGLSGYFKPFSGQGGGATGDAYAYATMLTGDRTYLNAAIRNTSDARCAGRPGPHYRTGTASSKTWSGGIGGYYQILFHAMRNWRPADTTPPAAVTDLRAEPGPNPGTVRLSWTNTGDDGSRGRAVAIQIKYAAGQIVELIPWGRQGINATVAPEWRGRVNFWYATNATGEPAPGAPGTRQTFLLTGLPRRNRTGQPVTLHFALKLHDEAGNRGGISNSVSVTVP